MGKKLEYLKRVSIIITALGMPCVIPGNEKQQPIRTLTFTESSTACSAIESHTPLIEVHLRLPLPLTTMDLGAPRTHWLTIYY